MRPGHTLVRSPIRSLWAVVCFVVILLSDGPIRAPASVALLRHLGVGRDGRIGLSKRLYVGNLPFSTTDQELRDLFEKHGEVTSVNVITDRETGRSRGFAFVEMEASNAEAAMQALDGRDMDGRPLRVNEARERESGGGGRGGGGRGGRGRF